MAFQDKTQSVEVDLNTSISFFFSSACQSRKSEVTSAQPFFLLATCKPEPARNKDGACPVRRARLLCSEICFLCKQGHYFKSKHHPEIKI